MCQEEKENKRKNAGRDDGNIAPQAFKSALFLLFGEVRNDRIRAYITGAMNFNRLGRRFSARNLSGVEPDDRYDTVRFTGAGEETKWTIKFV